MVLIQVYHVNTHPVTGPYYNKIESYFSNVDCPSPPASLPLAKVKDKSAMLFEGRPCAPSSAHSLNRSDRAAVQRARHGISKGVCRLEHPWNGVRGRDPASIGLIL